MFAPGRLASDSPNLTVSDLYFDRVERAWRWTIQNITGRCVESALVTRTLKALMIARVVNGTGQVCAFLTVSMVLTTGRLNQDRRIAFSGIVEIQARIRSERFSAFDLRGSKRLRLAGLNY